VVHQPTGALAAHSYQCRSLIAGSHGFIAGVGFSDTPLRLQVRENTVASIAGLPYQSDVAFVLKNFEFITLLDVSPLQPPEDWIYAT